MDILSNLHKKSRKNLTKSQQNLKSQQKIMETILNNQNELLRLRRNNWSVLRLTKHHRQEIGNMGNNRYDTKKKSKHKNHLKDNIHGNIKRTTFHQKRGRIIQKLEEYCQTSSLHGLRYIGDSNINIFERIFWLISFLVAVFCAAYFISNIHLKWNQFPVIVSYSPFSANINDIPFPAITFCSMNVVSKNMAQDIIKNGPALQQRFINYYCKSNLSIDGNVEKLTRQAVEETYINMGQSCASMLKLCQWDEETMSCQANFNNDILDDGMCCSFNRLPPHVVMRNPRIITLLNQTYPETIYNWSPESGFPEIVKDNGYIPRKPLGSGIHMGLTLVMDAQVENAFCSTTMGVGFKFLLLNPIDTPKMEYHGAYLSPGFENRISITPLIRAADPSLRNVPIKKRGCYFGNERKLYYYRTYSQTNCELECQSNITLKICNCVPFYLPHVAANEVCGEDEDACIRIAQNEMEITYTKGRNCECLPSCNDVGYTFRQSFTRLSYNKLPFDYKNSSIGNEEYFVKNMAVAHFYFENTEFSQVVKSEAFSFTDFLSNTGGLLGVFVGFSFLSVFEIIYFMWSQVAIFLKIK